jgi:ABC-type dipeptide/oligopeptide/nickel transport system ATPase subunit
MSKDLVLNSLEIRRFRCFRELRIAHLGRVNLIVGKNNVGKSTLLEALRLFARPASLGDLLEIFSGRDEIFTAELEEWSRSHVPSLPVDSLFFGRKATPGEENAITIGPINSTDDILRIVLNISNLQLLPAMQSVGPDKAVVNEIITKPYTTLRSLIFRVGPAAKSILVGIATSERLGFVPSTAGGSSPDVESSTMPIREFPLHSVGPDGLSLNIIVRLWDDVSLSSLEGDVIGALRIISPEVERVATKGPGDRIRATSQVKSVVNRVPFAKVQTDEEPIPLRAMGDGVNRLFGIALALVHAKDGLLLVDEIENGIHYSVQADLWRLVFETAARLNVQVFATTHSYDCIKAFEEAARESEEEGVLVRLARKGDRTLVGEFDERELEIAVEGEIEIR